MTMVMTMIGRRPLLGALLVICYSSLHHAVNGFISPHRALCRKQMLLEAKIDIDDDDSLQCSLSSLSSRNLSRRSAIAFGATAALANLFQIRPAEAAVSIPTWKIDQGAGNVEFPMLALNTAGMSTEEAFKAIEYARKAGITHVDFHPGLERDGMAKYLSKYNERDALFLNTKIRKAKIGTSPEDAATLARDQINEDLRVLNLNSVDMLMLRDSPDPKVIQAQWAVLEEALAEGKTKSIGVINFCPSALKSVLQTAKVVPALNYYMVHVGMGNDAHGLRSLGEKSGIRTFSYGQTGELPESMRTAILENPTVKRIAKAHGKSSEEVALRWVLQNGIAASVRPSQSFGRCEGKECEMGLAKYARCFDWALTDKEMAELDALTSPDDNPTLFSTAGCPGAWGT